jgi:hypothetical protein
MAVGEESLMQTLLWGLLVTIVLVSAVGRPPVALAEEPADDSSRPMAELAATVAEDGPLVARYLATFLKSRTTDPLRSATVVSVTNQASRVCQVSVEWGRGFEPTPACTTTVHLDPSITTDFCSRVIPVPLTTCNATCEPELTFHEGQAVVHSSPEEGCERIGVSARVYYTTGDSDDTLAAISDSKIVLFSKGNRGD